jgi:hypothetical protein
MTALYQLAVLGAPTEVQLEELRACLTTAVARCHLRLGHEVGWEVLPSEFKPYQLHPSATVFFAGSEPKLGNLAALIERGIPVLPVSSKVNDTLAGMPEALQSLQCLAYSEGNMQPICAALLECVGLLPKQRRVFISYRRDEAGEIAAQLFDALSARHFEVFLDTHDITSDKDLQALSWHRLYDSDVVLMLDTPNYFDHRWTSAEFGRVLAKGISVLRVGWPDSTLSIRAVVASRAQLAMNDIDVDSGRMTEGALERICNTLEEVRSQSHAVRSVNLISNLRIAVQNAGGRILGLGANQAVHIQLANGEPIVVYPSVGIPSPITLHDTLAQAAGQSVAVVYDHIGLHPEWVQHLDWLHDQGQSVRWIKASEAHWQFAHWSH